VQFGYSSRHGIVVNVAMACLHKITDLADGLGKEKNRPAHFSDRSDEPSAVAAQLHGMLINESART
jgi:hypothetical protein